MGGLTAERFTFHLPTASGGQHSKESGGNDNGRDGAAERYGVSYHPDGRPHEIGGAVIVWSRTARQHQLQLQSRQQKSTAINYDVNSADGDKDNDGGAYT